MSRDMTAAAITAAESEVVRVVLMADLDFESGHFRVHTGAGTLYFLGNPFIGIGDIGKVSELEETAQVQSSGLSLALSGIDPDLLSVALGENYQGRDVVLYLGLLDAGLQLIQDPVTLWRGRMDTMNIVLGETATITVTAKNPLADWDRPRVRRYNNEDQQAKYPGDLGLEFVEKSINKEILWGA